MGILYDVYWRIYKFNVREGSENLAAVRTGIWIRQRFYKLLYEARESVFSRRKPMSSLYPSWQRVKGTRPAYVSRVSLQAVL